MIRWKHCGQPKVTYFELKAIIEEEIAKFEVTMDHFLLMNIPQGL